MKKARNVLLGVLTGAVNVLVGACGGIIAVESLRLRGVDRTKSHATAIAVILPLTAISAAAYLVQGKVALSDSYIYIVPGLVGSFLGARLLPKIPQSILGKIFSFFMIYAGIRMILK